jgi:hypothetical protein
MPKLDYTHVYIIAFSLLALIEFVLKIQVGMFENFEIE